MRVIVGCALLIALIVGIAIWLDKKQPTSMEHTALRRGWELKLEATPQVVVTTPELGFVLAADESLHPSVRATDLQLRYRGWVMDDSERSLHFWVLKEGGEVRLTCRQVGGSVVADVIATGASDPITLQAPAGTLEIAVTFQRQGNARARLQLLWAQPGEGGFAREPLSPRQVSVPGNSKVTPHEEWRNGRVLLEEYGCMSCHEPNASERFAVESSPAPHLGWSAATFNAAWLQAWIAAPQTVHPGGAMPNVLVEMTESQRQNEATALTAFLMSQVPTLDVDAVASEAHLLAEGRRLYHQVGCVPCHGAFEPPAVIYDTASLSNDVPALNAQQAPLRGLGDKWRPLGVVPLPARPNTLSPDGDDAFDGVECRRGRSHHCLLAYPAAGSCEPRQLRGTSRSGDDHLGEEAL